MSDKFYVVVKLVSGETLMATLEAEDRAFVKVDYPIVIRTTIHPELEKESVSAAPFCAFTDATSFILDKTHIVFMKKLHPTFHEHYHRFVKIYEEVTFKENRYYDELDETAESETSEEPFTFVEGNDTKH
jgi:hypothetical protein